MKGVCVCVRECVCSGVCVCFVLVSFACFYSTNVKHFVKLGKLSSYCVPFLHQSPLSYVI